MSKINDTFVTNLYCTKKNGNEKYFVLTKGSLTPDLILNVIKENNGMRTGKTVTNIEKLVDDIPYDELETLLERVTKYLFEHKDRLVRVSGDPFETTYTRVYGWCENLDGISYCFIAPFSPEKKYILTEYEGEEDLVCLDDFEPFEDAPNIIECKKEW